MFKCKMCRFWETSKNKDELSISEWKDFIVSLEELGGSHIRLHFAGGEPLLKQGFLDLLEFANKRGFRTFIVTNGFLIDEAIAGKIVRSGVEGISISLDSLNEDTHDFLRGIKGAYKHAIQAINYLTKEDAKGIAILTIIMGSNLHDIVEIADWVESNNNISSIYFQAISQPIATLKDEQWYEKDEFSYLWPKDKIQLNSVIDQLIARKNKGYRISNSVRQFEVFKAYFRQPDKLYEGMTCTQGDYVMYIRPTGEVLLCGSLPAIGNIKTDSIKNIWNSPEAGLRRKQIYSCKESCLNVINCFTDKELP
ncbi:MAG: radical SAM protein [Candidatus Omnitrophica bacterium]|nr:radical SAM protein [Candidatus Omnitrophota bacterium]